MTLVSITVTKPPHNCTLSSLTCSRSNQLARLWHPIRARLGFNKLATSLLGLDPSIEGLDTDRLKH